MSFMSCDAAALRSALASSIPGLEVHQGTADDGLGWATVTYPACEFIMHRDAAGEWHADEHGTGQSRGTGATPADALMDALTDC